MTETPADRYASRLRKVLEYIEAHLEEDLSGERLSAVAAFSRYHFQRQFSALLGISVYRYVQLARSRRASYQLAFSAGRILDIALANGYESHEAFSRAFKRTVGQTPSEFRERPRWQPWHITHQPLRDLRSHYMKPAHSAADVKIVSFPETRVATLEHRGDPARIEETIARFISWRRANRLPRSSSATFNLLYGDPDDTPPQEFRLDLCVTTERPVAENELGVVERSIPAGRCALLRHVGSDDTLNESLRYLYSEWLPASGEELREFPLFIQRVSFFPDVPENEAISDVYLPLR